MGPLLEGFCLTEAAFENISSKPYKSFKLLATVRIVFWCLGGGTVVTPGKPWALIPGPEKFHP